MPRTARIVAIGHPHHITQRGNYQQDVFLDDADREIYLALIQEYSRKSRLNLLAYCLMTNHVHFIGVPEQEDSLAKTFNTAHMRYSQYFHKRIKRRGHLWQGRFYSCVLGESHLMAAARYIERNPIRAKMVKRGWDYPWSSAAYHAGKCKETPLKLDDFFSYIELAPRDWEGYIAAEDGEKDTKEIKEYTMKGLPLGTESFIKGLEAKFGKVLRPMPRGRPWYSEKK